MTAQKLKLTEQGQIVYPEHIGKLFALSTWAKKSVKIEYLEPCTKTEPVRENEYLFREDSEPLTEYGRKFHGDICTLENWYKRLGYKFVSAAIAAGVLVKRTIG